jgi:subtilisin family serine protease
MMASKVFARNMATTVARTQQPIKKVATSRAISTAAIRTGSKPVTTLALAGAAAAGTVMAITAANNGNKTFCDARRSSAMPVIMAGSAVEEPDTGIMFPPMVNGFTFMGCGVRIKYVFVKVYAVGAYLHPEDFAGMKDEAAIEKALLDPNKHKVIRIVMNRAMTMDKYNDAIVEALTPRMNGQDMDK